MCTQVTPLLAELRQGGMVANLEELTRSASDAAADIHRLQNEVRGGARSGCPLTCACRGLSDCCCVLRAVAPQAGHCFSVICATCRMKEL